MVWFIAMQLKKPSCIGILLLIHENLPVLVEVGTSLFIVVASLVPRPHPLTRRNGLVNQVKFCELAHNFTTVSPRKQFTLNPLKKGMVTGVEIKKIYCCKVITNLAISLVLTMFGE